MSIFEDLGLADLQSHLQYWKDRANKPSSSVIVNQQMIRMLEQLIAKKELELKDARN